jgi:hypothetical protein
LWWKHNWWWAVPIACLILYALSMAVGPLLLLSPVIYLSYRLAVKRADKMHKVCTALGFTFEEGPIQNLGARFGEFPCFTPQVTEFNIGQNMMTGSLAGHGVTVMDHSTGGGGRRAPDVRETLTVFPAGPKGLPDFRLSPGGGRVLDKIVAALGVQDINFPENAEFSNHYTLRGTDEAAIRRAFGATTQAFFAANQGWSVEVHRGAIAIYRGWKLIAPANVPGFLGETITVFSAFDRNQA